MLCQFCKKRMQKGKLYNGRRDMGLVWYPDGVKPPLLCSQKIVEARGGVILNQNSFSAYGSSIEVYFCRSCGKGILSMETKEAFSKSRK